MLGGSATPHSSQAITMSEAFGTEFDRRLDTREIEGEPFGAIVNELEQLDSGERFLLINSFEPVPLYDVLEERGFEADAQAVAEDEWHVVVTHAE